MFLFELLVFVDGVMQDRRPCRLRRKRRKGFHIKVSQITRRKLPSLRDINQNMRERNLRHKWLFSNSAATFFLLIFATRMKLDSLDVLGMNPWRGWSFNLVLSLNNPQQRDCETNFFIVKSSRRTQWFLFWLLTRCQISRLRAERPRIGHFPMNIIMETVPCLQKWKLSDINIFLPHHSQTWP